MPKKATKPKQKNTSVRRLRSQLRELEADLEIMNLYAKDLRGELNKLLAGDEEKLHMIQKAVGEKLEALELVSLLRERNKRTRAWNQRQRDLIEALTLANEGLRRDNEDLELELGKLALVSSVLGFAFVNTPDGFTHEDKIQHLMNASELLEIDFLNLRSTFELVLSLGYSATIPATMDRLLNKTEG